MDTAAVGTTIDSKLVNELPLNGRTFAQLATLVPGLAPQGATNIGTFTLLSCHPFLIMIFLTSEKLGGYSLCATTPGLRWPLALIGSFKLALLALTLFGLHSNALALDP